MSLIIKDCPRGIDKEIDFLQKKIYENLIELGWTNYDSYPRAYKNYKAGQLIPEIYIGNKEYSECLFNDKLNATSFFVASDNKKQINPGVYEQGVSIIFQVKLNALYPSILHRADEEAQEDVISAIIKDQQEIDIDSIKIGVDNVYSEFVFNNDYDKRIKITDMSDYHVFRIDLTLNYTNDSCKCQ